MKASKGRLTTGIDFYAKEYKIYTDSRHAEIEINMKQTHCYICGKKLNFLFTSLKKYEGHKICTSCDIKRATAESKRIWAEGKEERKQLNQKNKEEFEKKKQEFLARKNAPKKITETRVTCKFCGNVWHYGKQEQMDNATNSLHNAGKAMMCCTGCLPALLLSDKKITDFSKCPKCGSKSVKSEQVTHEV